MYLNVPQFELLQQIISEFKQLDICTNQFIIEKDNVLKDYINHCLHWKQLQQKEPAFITNSSQISTNPTQFTTNPSSCQHIESYLQTPPKSVQILVNATQTRAKTLPKSPKNPLPKP